MILVIRLLLLLFPFVVIGENDDERIKEAFFKFDKTNGACIENFLTLMNKHMSAEERAHWEEVPKLKIIDFNAFLEDFKFDHENNEVVLTKLEMKRGALDFTDNDDEMRFKFYIYDGFKYSFTPNGRVLPQNMAKIAFMIHWQAQAPSKEIKKEMWKFKDYNMMFDGRKDVYLCDLLKIALSPPKKKETGKSKVKKGKEGSSEQLQSMVDVREGFRTMFEKLYNNKDHTKLRSMTSQWEYLDRYKYWNNICSSRREDEKILFKVALEKFANNFITKEGRFQTYNEMRNIFNDYEWDNVKKFVYPALEFYIHRQQQFDASELSEIPVLISLCISQMENKNKLSYSKLKSELSEKGLILKAMLEKWKPSWLEKLPVGIENPNNFYLNHRYDFNRFKGSMFMPIEEMDHKHVSHLFNIQQKNNWKNWAIDAYGNVPHSFEDPNLVESFLKIYPNMYKKSKKTGKQLLKMNMEYFIGLKKRIPNQLGDRFNNKVGKQSSVVDHFGGLQISQLPKNVEAWLSQCLEAYLLLMGKKSVDQLDSTEQINFLFQTNLRIFNRLIKEISQLPQRYYPSQTSHQKPYDQQQQQPHPAYSAYYPPSPSNPTYPQHPAYPQPPHTQYGNPNLQQPEAAYGYPPPAHQPPYGGYPPPPPQPPTHAYPPPAAQQPPYGGYPPPQQPPYGGYPPPTHQAPYGGYPPPPQPPTHAYPPPAAQQPPYGGYPPPQQPPYGGYPPPTHQAPYGGYPPPPQPPTHAYPPPAAQQPPYGGYPPPQQPPTHGYLHQQQKRHHRSPDPPQQPQQGNQLLGVMDELGRNLVKALVILNKRNEIDNENKIKNCEEVSKEISLHEYKMTKNQIMEKKMVSTNANMSNILTAGRRSELSSLFQRDECVEQLNVFQTLWQFDIQLKYDTNFVQDLYNLFDISSLLDTDYSYRKYERKYNFDIRLGRQIKDLKNVIKGKTKLKETVKRMMGQIDTKLWLHAEGQFEMLIGKISIGYHSEKRNKKNEPVDFAYYKLAEFIAVQLSIHILSAGIYALNRLMREAIWADTIDGTNKFQEIQFKWDPNDDNEIGQHDKFRHQRVQQLSKVGSSAGKKGENRIQQKNGFEILGKLHTKMNSLGHAFHDIEYAQKDKSWEWIEKKIEGLRKEPSSSDWKLQASVQALAAKVEQMTKQKEKLGKIFAEMSLKSNKKKKKGLGEKIGKKIVKKIVKRKKKKEKGHHEKEDEGEEEEQEEEEGEEQSSSDEQEEYEDGENEDIVMWDPESVGEQFEEFGEIAELPEFSPDFDFSDSLGDFGVDFSDFTDIDFGGGGGFDFSEALNSDNFAEGLGETLISFGDGNSGSSGWFSGSSDSGSSWFSGGGDSGGGGSDWFSSSD